MRLNGVVGPLALRRRDVYPGARLFLVSRKYALLFFFLLLPTL